MNGMYDDVVEIQEIQEIQELKMVDDIPRDTIKNNGFATERRSLGSFSSKEWGGGRHYVYTKSPPYIWVKTKNSYYLFNSKNPNETSKWYEEISNAWSSQK